MEQHQLSKDYQIQPHDNFQHSNDTKEKFPIRSRTNSGCANNNKLISEKTLSISSLQNVVESKCDTSGNSANSITSLDSADHRKYGRRKWEEDRSIVFRHKLKEGKNLFKLIENSKRPQTKSSVLSSIDKILHDEEYVSPSQCEQKQIGSASSSVILYSYQNPPFSMPPSGGCRKQHGHSSLPAEFRSSVTTLPPIGIKIDDGGIQINEGAMKNSHQNNDEFNYASSISNNSSITSDNVTNPESSSNKGEHILRRRLSGESVA